MAHLIYHVAYKESLGADRWIANSWLKGFKFHGWTAELFSGNLKSIKKLNILPKVLITDLCILQSSDAETLIQLRKSGVRVAIWVHWPLLPIVSKEVASFIKPGGLADVWFGELEPNVMCNFELSTGCKYLSLPQAASHEDHFPVEPESHYEYDIAFIGAKLPKKEWFNDLILKHLIKKYKVGIFGPGWTTQDNLKRGISALLKKIKLKNISSIIDNTRISIDLADEKKLYSSAKICINAHERELDMSISHNIINQRTFKICASGGFQMVDDVPGIRNYFNDDEIIIIKPDIDKWLNLIDYFLKNQSERESIRKRGIMRAHNSHYSYHRVEKLLKELGISN